MGLFRRCLFIGRIAARQQLAYRGEFLMRAVAMLIFMGIFMALWSTVYAVSGNATESGYTLRDIVWYLVMTETVMMSSSRIFLDMGEAVCSGAVAYTLARPVSFPLFQAATSLGTSAPRFALNLATGALVVGLGVGFGVGSLPGLLAFVVLATLALSLDALIAVLIGLLAFWMEETQPVFWIYQKLLFTVGGLFLPLEFFPDWLRVISRWLPFHFITYAPARAFVAFAPGEVAQLALGQILYLAFFGALVVLVWRAAQRRLVVQGG